MGSAPSNTSATAGSPTLIDYEAWVRRQPDIPADALILEKPTAEVAARVDEARRRDVAAIVSGFLPDEVDWPVLGWSDTLAFFAERFVFTPYLIDVGESERAGGSGHVLWINDHRYSEPVAAPTDLLARACAAAAGVEFRALDIGGATSEQAVREFAGASLVVNAVNEWSAGFAIDELAARLGVGVLRPHNPGYSPLRYALLGQMLPPEREAEVARLRPKLCEAGWPRMESRAPAETATWFRGADASQWWRQVMDAAAFKAFWTDQKWTAFRAREAGADRGCWLNRPAAWAALAAFGDDVKVPKAARECATVTIAEWLADEVKSVDSGFVRDEAVPRWLLRHPEWLESYRRRAGGGRDARARVALWVIKAGMRAETGSRFLSLLRAATTLKGDGGTPVPLLIAFAWATQWSDLPELFDTGAQMTGPMRALCAVACYSRVTATAQKDATNDELNLESEPLWRRSELWDWSLGGSAPILRIMAAASRRRSSDACAILRELAQRARLKTMRGVLRLSRVGFQSEEKLVPWLRRAAHGESNDLRALIANAVNVWLAARRWALWRVNLSSEVEKELSIAHRVLSELVEGGGAETWPARALVRIAAIRCDEAATREALATATAIGAKPYELYWPVVSIWWFQGRSAAAQALFQEWPEEAAAEAPPVWFVRAVAAQLVGDLASASAALGRLRGGTASGFSANNGLTEWHRLWLAIVCKTSGRSREAGVFLKEALIWAPECIGMFEDVAEDFVPLADGWEAWLGGKNQSNSIRRG